MPLPLLAAVATNAGAVFGYNRANFLHDSGQRVQRQYAGLSYQMQLFNLYRQDIRDLVGLTTEKMSNYHVVACLELGMACTLLGPARLPGQVPEWVLWYQLVSLCAAVGFLVASMWLATRAVVVAGSFNVRLQTQYIRLPLPDDEMLDSALTRAEEFESKDLFGLLRLPFFRSLWQRFMPSSSAAQEAARDPQKPSSAAPPGGSGGGASAGQAAQAAGFANDQTASHLKLYQHLQRKWSCYDAYARVTMSVGTYWMVLSLAYYEIGWVLCFQGKVLPAVVAAGLFCGILILLIYLDIFVSRTEMASVAILLCAGPALVSAGAVATLRGEPDETPWFAAATGVVHICLTVWMWNVGSMVPGKTDLPAKFKGVSYLDIFGPIVRELQSVLDMTGLAGHAHTDHEGSGDGGGGGGRAGKAVAPTDIRVNIPGPRLDAVREQLAAAMEAKAGPSARQLRKLHNAVQCAHLAGLDPNDEQYKAAELALSRLEVPREMRKVRKILTEWREGEVWRYLDDEQRLLVEQMCVDLDAALGQIHHGAWAAARQPGKANGGGGQQGSNGSSEVARGRPAARSTVGGGATSCAGRSLSEGLVGCTGGFGGGRPPAISRSQSDSTDWSEPEDEDIPVDARSMQFETICDRCDALMMRAEALVASNTAGKVRAGLPPLPHQSSSTSLASSQITEGASSEVGDARKKRRRHGHHPVLAYRIMSAGLVAVWAVGTFMHATRHELFQDIAPWVPGRRLDGRRKATTSAEVAFTFRWPARFFRPQGAALCRSTGAGGSGVDAVAATGPVELMASNGFLLYGLQVSADPLSPYPRRKLACPVDVHEALVVADCPAAGKECQAVVAAEGSLWRCSQRAAFAAKLGVAAKPLASLSQDFVESHDAMEVWATADHNLTTVFAGSRRGSIFQFRRAGANLRPVAELQLPPAAPRGLEWLLLSVRGDTLVGLAAPGPVAISWSLATGQPQAAQPLRSSAGLSSWCAGSGGELYGIGPASGADEDRHTWGLHSVSLPVV